MKPPIPPETDPDTDDNNNDGVDAEDLSQESLVKSLQAGIEHEAHPASDLLGIDLSSRRSLFTGQQSTAHQPRQVGLHKPILSANSINRARKATGVSCANKKAAQQPVPGLNPFLGSLATPSGECNR